MKFFFNVSVILSIYFFSMPITLHSMQQQTINITPSMLVALASNPTLLSAMFALDAAPKIPSLDKPKPKYDRCEKKQRPKTLQNVKNQQNIRIVKPNKNNKIKYAGKKQQSKNK